MGGHQISELAGRTGIPVTTLRYHEDIGVGLAVVRGAFRRRGRRRSVQPVPVAIDLPADLLALGTGTRRS
jgi:hypothetical protein